MSASEHAPEQSVEQGGPWFPLPLAGLGLPSFFLRFAFTGGLACSPAMTLSNEAFSESLIALHRALLGELTAELFLSDLKQSARGKGLRSRRQQLPGCRGLGVIPGEK